jgi:hypothetical protein
MFEFHVYLHLIVPPGLISAVTRHEFRHLERLMSDISDKIAALSAAQDLTDSKLDAFVVRHTDEVAAEQAALADLRAQIVALQALVDAGGTEADKTALDTLIAREAEHQVKLDALDPTSPVVLPEP